jgi:uncharacterized protein (UPF0332 family)
MLAYVGPPPKDRWEHVGLRKAFTQKLYQEGYANIRLINKDASALYDLRIDADYSISSVIDVKDAKRALKIAANMLSLVKEIIK